MSAVTNKEIRSRAADAVNFNLGRVIMLSVTALAVPLLLNFWGASSSIVTTLSGMAEKITRYGADYYTAETYLNTLAAAFTSTGVFAVLASLASMVLQVGFTRGLQRLANHEPVKAGVLLPHWKHIPGCVGLRMWLALKTLAWALPGLLVETLGVMFMTEGVAAGEFIQIVGRILQAALVIPATYRYMLAHHVFAETPEVGVYDAVARSKSIMATRKWQLFCLTLPHALGIVGVWVALIALMAIFATTGFMGAFAVWLVLVLFMAVVAATAYLCMLAGMAIACYYLAHK